MIFVFECILTKLGNATHNGARWRFARSHSTLKPGGWLRRPHDQPPAAHRGSNRVTMLRSLRKTAMTLGAMAFAASLAIRLQRRISFNGRVVLITGGSRGLGLALAREFAREGARLALVARDEAMMNRAAIDLEKRGAEVFTVLADLRDREQAENAVKLTLGRFGSIDVLINNAGIITVGPLEEMEPGDFENALATHAWAPLFMMNAVVPQMKKRNQGRIVNIASIGGKIAVPHLGPYSMSKFALVGLSDSYRNELARHGVRVTTVCPGLMRTGSHINAMFKGRQKREFAWFSLASATPVTSMAASRAAKKIVRACRYGQPQLIISWQARLAALGAALFPNLAANILGAINRTLPGAEGGQEDAKPGWECRSNFPPAFVTRLSDQASEEYNETPVKGARRRMPE
jgi:NAD(P)-dependent dehydrogenase (short-subunit alcohol dehydrogenase family)